MRRRNRLAGCVVLMCAAFLSMANGPVVQKAQAAEDPSNAVRRELNAYADAWNRGDRSAVIAQYHPSFFGILQSDSLDYVGYTDQVRKLMAEEVRPRLGLEIHTLRPLTHDDVLANGRVHTLPKEGSEQSAPFTVIYHRFGKRWQLVYAHS